MKGTGKFLLGVCSLSAMLLFYVHLQVSLFSISYSIDINSKELAQAQEKYRHLKYEVEQLTSPQTLAEQMDHLKLELVLPSEIQLVELPEQALPDLVMAKSEVLEPFSQGLNDFFGKWVRIAQANTEK